VSGEEETSGEDGFEGWAILELMGHRRLGGRISEATIAGGAFIRIDIPHPNAIGMFRASRFYSPSAVYAITPTTEDVACAIGRRAPGPVSRWEQPALPQRSHNDAVAQDAFEVDDEPPLWNLNRISNDVAGPHWRAPATQWQRRTRPADERARSQRERESRPWIQAPSPPNG
jgi:hypothetical protein